MSYHILVFYSLFWGLIILIYISSSIYSWMTALWLDDGFMLRSDMLFNYIVLFDWFYELYTLDELFDDVCKDFYESTFAVGKLSIDVSIFNSFSYFYILNRLLRVDFAFKDDLLFNTSYLIMHPKLGKFIELLQLFLSISFYFNYLFYFKFTCSFLGT